MQTLVLLSWSGVLEFLEMLVDSGILGYLIGLIGLAGFTAAYNVYKTGRKTLNYREQAGRDGKWTEEEKTKYIEISGEFWDAIKNFWQVIIKGLGIKKIFKK
jgi:hypothetical protein